MNHSTAMNRYLRLPGRQSGFALIVGLIVLVLLTIIMLTALKMAALEERMAGNLRNQNIAFQAAESALREAETMIATSEAPFDWTGDGSVDPNPFNPLKLSGGPFQNTSSPVCVRGFCGETAPLQSAAIRSLADTAVRTSDMDIPGIPEPQYVIELVTIEPSTDARRVYATFRITARAWGEDPNSLVELQSTYRSHVRSFVY